MKDARETSFSRNFNWLREVLTICQFNSKAFIDCIPQCGDGSARGKNRDTVLRTGLLKQAVQATLDALDEALPAFQAFLFVFARNPSLNHVTEQALELGAVIGRIVQNAQSVRLDAQQIVHMRPNHLVGEEFIECRKDFNFRLRYSAAVFQLFERRLCRILLTLQFAADTAVEAKVQLIEIVTQGSCLAKAER